MLGFVAENMINNLVDVVQWNDVQDLLNTKAFILDVRETIEFDLGHIPNAVNIPLTVLRDNLDKLPKNDPIYIYCQTGIRAYNATRILKQIGFNVYNLDGAFRTYQCVHNPGDSVACHDVDDMGNMTFDTPVNATADTMDATITVNAVGLQCPGPIVKAYKNLETLNDGEILSISASDPGFEKDVVAWCKSRGHALVSVEKDNSIVTATIQKHGIKPSQKSFPTEKNDGSTIVVFSQDLDKAIAAFIIAQGAKTMGKDVSLFFTFWGLNILRKDHKHRVKKSFVEKMFARMMPRGPKNLPSSNMNMAGIGPKMMRKIMKKKSVDSLELMIEKAKDMGIKLTACAMSMDILGIKEEELIDGVEMAGVASYLSDTDKSSHNLFI
jgi:peroxiredoxin family protein/rhodanese-related sulfurtransferase/TusA-related sulfurtransferase